MVVKRHVFVQGGREFSRALVKVVEVGLQKSFSVSSGPFWEVRHQMTSWGIQRNYKSA